MRAFASASLIRASAAEMLGLSRQSLYVKLRRYGLGDDPYHPYDSIMAGAAYIREMHDRYGNVTAMLAAYNAGPGRYAEHLVRGRRPDEPGGLHGRSLRAQREMSRWVRTLKPRELSDCAARSSTRASPTPSPPTSKSRGSTIRTAKRI